MDNLHPHAELLLSYADNRISESNKEKAEQILATDSTAREFLALLGHSDLPYEESFAFLLSDDIKASSQNIEKTKEDKKPVWFWPASLVASVMLGLGIGYAAFLSKYEDHDNWIVQVADYHLLYVRETVTGSQPDSLAVKALSEKLGNALNTKLVIPDLSKNQIAFKRGQILQSDDRPLIQLAYLPDVGQPVALCILRNDMPDALPKKGNSRGMPYVKWSKDGLSYVIIGKIEEAALEAAALNAVSQLKS